MTTEAKKSIIRELIEWISVILGAVILAVILRTFVFQLIVVQGPSMEQTLQNNDKLIIYKLGYYFSPPKKGDIVVFMHDEGVSGILSFMTETDYIKRVIAVPGQTVDIKDGKVFVDGVEQSEDYSNGGTYAIGDTKFPIKVEEGTVFVLGDNRPNSMDSRFKSVDLVHVKDIRGKATIRIWPFDKFGGF